MVRSSRKSCRSSRDCSRGRLREREQSKDFVHKGKSVRDRSREDSRNRSQDDSRNRSRYERENRSRGRNVYDSDRSKDRDHGESRDRGRDESRDRKRDTLRNRRCSESRDRWRHSSRDNSLDSYCESLHNDACAERRRSWDRERNSACGHSRRRNRSMDSSGSENLRATVKCLRQQLQAVRYRPGNEEFLIPKFDPAKDSADVEQWTRQVDRIARRYNWSDDDILLVVARSLKGHARRVYDEELVNDHTWRSLKTILLRRFKKPLPFARLLLEAATYTASAGQHLGDYCFEKLSKLRALKLDIPDAYLADAVIGGIQDENVTRTIRSKRYKDADELYAAMNEMGAMPQRTDSENENEVFTPTGSPGSSTTEG
ncbi:uncharacterized protein LOC143265284 [Megachile rotundata]|uniref:uncharacterized protein LOC143265284 n=1 Tax=Megachile rotundata TaxID=143995 RepID=UPI003FD67687